MFKALKRMFARRVPAEEVPWSYRPIEGDRVYVGTTPGVHEVRMVDSWNDTVLLLNLSTYSRVVVPIDWITPTSFTLKQRREQVR